MAEAPRGNLGSLGLIQAFRLLSGLAVNVLLMRALGVEGYGVYGYVMTLVGLCSFGASMGMGRYLQREIARAPQDAGRLVATGLAAGLGLSTLTGLVILAWAAGMDGRPVVLLAAGLGAVAVGVQSLVSVPIAYFHGLREMGLGVKGNAAGRVVLVVSTFVLLLGFQFGVAGVFAAQVLDALVTLAIVGNVALRRIDREALRTSWADVRQLITVCVPFGLNALFGSIYLSVDVVLLEEMRGDTEVGIYRGAVMLISLFPVLADTLTTGVYPRMSRNLGDRGATGAELSFLARILLAVSVPAAVGGMLVAEPLMVFIGGDAWSVSALPFIVMAPMLPLRYLNNGLGMTLSAMNAQKDRTRGVFLAAIVNLVGNLLVIPEHGAAGAAATTLGTEIALAAWMHWKVRPHITSMGLLPTLGRVALPAALMGGVIWALPSLHVVLVIAIGVAVYALGALVTGAVRRDDWRALRRV